MKPGLLVVGLAVLFGACSGEQAPPVEATPVEETTDTDYQIGEARYEMHCAGCHSGTMPEAQTIEALRLYTPEALVKSMTSGVMSTAALPLSEPEIRQVAYYLTGKMPGTADREQAQYRCDGDFPAASGLAAASWTSWGGENHNRRHQASETVLGRGNVEMLELKWAFAFPQATRARSQPTISADVIYIGSQDGTVYALDRATGCVYWTFAADTEVRGAIQLHEDAESGKRRLLFGDFKANAYSVDAATGALLWKTPVHEHPLATITGSVVADQSKVYVPVSSSEVVPAARSNYPCCTFRGALVAIDIADGSIAWRTYTTPEPVLRGKNSAGADNFGPSGAPIWSAPTLDPRRNLVLVGTGQNYSSPATGTSDAIIAMDTASGDIRWVSQVTENDAWNGGCSRRTANCPEEDGPDFDIGLSPVLVTARSGKDVLLVGQKSGLVYAMNPDNDGEILWTRRVGSGGTMGGVHWGMASDGDRLYVGMSDLPTINRYKVGEPQPGVHALDPLTGEFIWRTPVPNVCPQDIKFFCFPAISAAVSSSPGLVFAGGLDGVLRAFDAENGDILWTYNTVQEYQTVNGVDGNGGAIEADGPVIVHGELFVTSGYDKWAEMPGNVLLKFALPEERRAADR